MIRFFLSLVILTIAIFGGQYISNHNYHAFIQWDQQLIKVNLWLIILLLFFGFIIFYLLLKFLFKLLNLKADIKNTFSQLRGKKVVRYHTEFIETLVSGEEEKLIQADIRLFHSTGKIAYLMQAYYTLYQGNQNKVQYKQLNKLIIQKVFKNTENVTDNISFYSLQLLYRLFENTTPHTQIKHISEELSIFAIQQNEQISVNMNLIKEHMLDKNALFIGLLMHYLTLYDQFKTAYTFLDSNDNKNAFNYMQCDDLNQLINFSLINSLKEYEQVQEQVTQNMLIYKKLNKKLNNIELMKVLDENYINYLIEYEQWAALNTLCNSISKNPTMWENTLFDAYVILSDHSVDIHSLISKMIKFLDINPDFLYLNLVIAQLTEKAGILNKSKEYYQKYLDKKMDLKIYKKYQQIINDEHNVQTQTPSITSININKQ